MTQIESFGVHVLTQKEVSEIWGGAEAATGSYAAGYAVGAWFREMYNIWSYGRTHLTDR